MLSEGWAGAAQVLPYEHAIARLSGQQQEMLPRLVRRLIDLRPMRWSTLGRYAKRGLDRVDVEEAVMALHRAGWVEIRRRRDRRGDLEPHQLRLCETSVEAAAALVEPKAKPREQVLVTILGALQERHAAGSAPIPERVLVQKLFGQTKSVRIREHRIELEAALGVPVERLVRFHVDVVLTAGPVRYRYRGVPVDLRGSHPWAAITEPVVRDLTELVVEGVEEIVCVENQTPFESLLYQGLAERAVVVFTSGYLGTVQRLWLQKLIVAGIRTVRHWGDLDPWGLDIYRDLADHVLRIDPGVVVEPWRMEPTPLEREDTQALTTEDWIALHRYLGQDEAPLRETAEVMKRLGCKIEQEALLLG